MNWGGGGWVCVRDGSPKGHALGVIHDSPAESGEASTQRLSS